MSRRRSALSEFLSAWEQASTPVAWIQADRRIEYVNSSMAACLGAAADALRDVICDYHSDAVADALDADAVFKLRAAASICPPPQCFQGTWVRAAVVLPEGAESAALFVPWQSSQQGGQYSVLVFLGENYHGTGKSCFDETDAAALHQAIASQQAKFSFRGLPGPLLGGSAAAEMLRERWKLAQAGGCNTHVFGPRGAGKRELATRLHFLSQTSGPLTPLPCDILPGDLILSTVDAVLAERPLGGSILLLDVDKLGKGAQEALLEKLNNARGGIRLLSTSEGRLEGDELLPGLASKLKTLQLGLLRLAERREDLPLLLQHAVEESNHGDARQIAGFEADALDRLCRYDWPGEYGELKKLVFEARTRTNSPKIQVQDLPPVIGHAEYAAAHRRKTPHRIVLGKFLADIEEQLIRRALAQARGNKTLAAKLLGMTRPRLYRRLVQLGLAEADAPPDATR